MSARYAFRLDDIHPGMRQEQFARVRAILDRHGVKPLIAIIPDNKDAALEHDPHDPGFWELVRDLQRGGWTVAMHGLTHRYVSRDAGLVGLNRYSEFAGLPYEEQREKLATGKRLLQGHGIETDVFVAPAHSFDAMTCRALVAEGFRFVSDGIALWPFEQYGLTWVPQAAWKPRPFPFGEVTFCFHTDAFASRDLDGLEAFLRGHRDRVVDFSAFLQAAPPRSSVHAALSFLFRCAFFLRRLVKLGAFATEKPAFDAPDMYEHRRLEDPMENYTYSAYWEAFLAPWVEGLATGVVADLGAGTGLALSRMPRATRIEAVEISPRMLDVARARYVGDARIVFREEDATATALPDASVDSVVSIGVLGYVPVERQLKEIARITRPGARILLTTPNRYNPFHLLVQLRDLVLGRKHGKRFHSPFRLRRRFEEAGLAVVRTDSRGTIFWLPRFMRGAAVPLYALLDRLWAPLQPYFPIGGDVCFELRR